MSSFTKCIMDLQNTNFLMNRAENALKIIILWSVLIMQKQILKGFWASGSKPRSSSTLALTKNVCLSSKFWSEKNTYLARTLGWLITWTNLLVILVFLEPSLTVLLLTLTNKDVGLAGNWSFTRLNWRGSCRRRFIPPTLSHLVSTRRSAFRNCQGEYTMIKARRLRIYVCLWNVDQLTKQQKYHLFGYELNFRVSFM